MAEDTNTPASDRLLAAREGNAMEGANQGQASGRDWAFETRVDETTACVSH